MTDTTSPAAGEGAPAGRKRLLLLLPFVAFLALAGLFLYQLFEGGDPSRIPSALINKPVPAFTLPPIEEGNGPGLSSEELKKGVHLVNVWASWCVPCRQEHPLLMQLAEDKRFTLVGINYKDVPENAMRFMGALGNPFAELGADRQGTTAIDWGVYGVPETFLVKDGIILHKFIGPLSPEGLQADLMPAIEKALGGS